MNPNNDHNIQEQFELIESYLSGTLTSNELEKFEKRLKSDTDLQKKVSEHNLLINAIESQSLIEKMDHFHQNRTSIPALGKYSFKRYAIAASFIILMGLGGYWIFNQNGNQRLYSKYFKPDSGLATTMGTTQNFEFYNGMVSYKQGSYNIAISKWEELLINKEQSDTLNYFLGVAHLANNNEFKATEYLNKVIDIQQSTFLNEAYYYLGLAYLKSDMVELAKTNLNLSNLDNSKSLLNELNDY